MTSVDLPEPETPVTLQSTPSGTLHVDVLEVVLGRTLDLDVASRLATLPRDLDPAGARQELPGERLGNLRDLIGGALRDHVAAVLTGERADVEHMVGGAHRVLVVLDDQHGVAEVAQTLERRDQLVVVALVQADRGLVEDVEHAHQRRADLRRQADPLRLTA